MSFRESVVEGVSVNLKSRSPVSAMLKPSKLSKLSEVPRA